MCWDRTGLLTPALSQHKNFQNLITVRGIDLQFVDLVSEISIIEMANIYSENML